jgi:DNA polymerase II small subunit/DNA polymerase delta subunit B
MMGIHSAKSFALGNGASVISNPSCVRLDGNRVDLLTFLGKNPNAVAAEYPELIEPVKE